MKAKVAWLLIFLLGFVGSVNADPIFSARIVCIGGLGCTPGLAPPPVINSPFPVFVEAHPVLLTPEGGTVTEHAFAAASPGVVRGLSSVTADAPVFAPFFGASGVAQERSRFLLDNILLSGPDPLGTIIPVSFNASISGSFGGIALGLGSGWSLSAGVALDFGSSLGGIGNFPLGSLTAHYLFGVTRTGIFSTFPDSGAGAGFTASPVFQARVGDMLTVGLPLETSTLAGIANAFFGGGGPGHADAFVDFSDGLGFPTIGPVFNLPDGFTVSSSDGFIVNNHFAPPGVEPIPEPGTLLLLGSGLLGVAGYGRKKLFRKA